MLACQRLSLRPLPFSLNFVVPFIIGDYSTFDFALVRHVVSSLVGLYILISEKDVMRHLTLRNCLKAIWLAFVGYVGYFLTVTGAAIFAGPVIAPAFLGLVPIVSMVIGNQRQGSMPWRFLMLPLALVLVGLVFVNGTAFTAEGLNSVQSVWTGVPLSLAAVGLGSGSPLPIRLHSPPDQKCPPVCGQR